MFSRCANPDCQAPFDCECGRLFRFHKNYPAAEAPPNTHAVQHFWLCGVCVETYTLEYQSERGVLIRKHPVVAPAADTLRFIAAA
jgi:hypothetical protein